MLSDKTLEEITRHTNPNSLLAITVKKLRRIKTPFRVRCVKEVGKFYRGQVLQVESVHAKRDHPLVYKIQRKKYPYSYFKIIE